jgi:hypothetical protein
VATLSTNGRLIQLDVWDMLDSQSARNKDDSDEDDEKRAPFLPRLCGQYQPPLSNKALSDLGMYNRVTNCAHATHT